MSSIDLFFESIERNYKEAVLDKQISPEARKQVRMSRAGHKEINSQHLALLSKVLKKDFHTLPQKEKDRITNKLGFGSNPNKEIQNNKIIKGSWVHPNTLLTTGWHEDMKGIDVDALTFIFTKEDQKLLAPLPGINTIHLDIFNDLKIPINNDVISGRVLKLPQSVDSNRMYDFKDQILPKGNHLALWSVPSEEELQSILQELPSSFKPDYIHLPKDI